MSTIAELILTHTDDDHLAILSEDESWTYQEYVSACISRAHLLLELRREGHFHVGLLLDNVPEFPMLLGAAALSGATIVGINSTRRGAELERDIRHTDCQLIVTEERYLDLLADLDLPVPRERILVVESDAWKQAVALHRGKPAPSVEIDPLAPYLLIFTSGTTGSPKAAICSQGRLWLVGSILTQMQGFTPEDRSYQVMPMFHSNALMAGWAPTLSSGATSVLRRKFSASGFVQDVRRYGVTYFNYVGKPLAYILATPEAPDDADNTLVRCFGNEAGERDIGHFEKRFGCRVTDGYGSTEGAIAISRTPDTPPGALGVGQPGTLVLDPETGKECPPARFDENGRLLNADDAIGEIANNQSAASFEGYWNNEEAAAQRIRNSIFWSGDLGYRDDKGFIYFAGRDFDWLRVDGENLATAPIERILSRHLDVSIAVVYAVPNATVGDDVMATLVLRPRSHFDPEGFQLFLDDQADLGTKMAPRYVRISSQLPLTPSNKILKRALRKQRWECEEPVWIREPERGYRLLEPGDEERIRSEFAARDRESALGA